MKKYGLLLCILLSMHVFSACNNDDAPRSAMDTSPDSQAATEEPATTPPVSEQSAVSDAFRETVPVTEPVPQAHDAPVADAPYRDAAIAIRVVDLAGNPVRSLSGSLELGIADENSTPPGIGLQGSDASQAFTGGDGMLYFTDNPEMLPENGTLILSAYYDSSLRQRIPMDFQASGVITVTWSGETPPSAAPEPVTRQIIFYIVDANGNPVAGVSGGLEQSADGSVHYRHLSGKGADSAASDDSGRLFLDLEMGWEAQAASRAYKLIVYGHYDTSLRLEFSVELPDPPASYTIPWDLPHPPKERPAQTTGIRFFIVDAQNAPVSGVELSGSPYPKNTTDSAVPDIAMILGPSDGQGYIRWDDVRPGIYELTGHKDGLTRQYQLEMPEDKAMVDMTLIWNP